MMQPTLEWRMVDEKTDRTDRHGTTVDGGLTRSPVIVETRFPLVQRESGIEVDVTARVKTDGTRRRSDQLPHEHAQSVELLAVHHLVTVRVQLGEFPLHHGCSQVDARQTDAVRYLGVPLDHRQLCRPHTNNISDALPLNRGHI